MNDSALINNTNEQNIIKLSLKGRKRKRAERGVREWRDSISIADEYNTFSKSLH